LIFARTRRAVGSPRGAREAYADIERPSMLPGRHRSAEGPRRGRQHPGCEATAQFVAGRENCVTPEHFLLAGPAI